MTYEENALAHYGIKGQKWGLRRFQNEDRTLTEAGKLRYRVGSGNEAKDAKIYSKEVKKYNKLRDKADIDLQRQKSEKHEKNAVKAAKVAGKLGVAAVGSAGILGGLSNANNREANIKSSLADIYGQLPEKSMNSLNKKWAEYDFSKAYARSRAFANAAMISSASLLGASFIAAGVAGQQKARSMIEKRRTTPAGHAKATKRLEAQYNKMIDMFGHTPYKALVEALPKGKD